MSGTSGGSPSGCSRTLAVHPWDLQMTQRHQNAFWRSAGVGHHRRTAVSREGAGVVAVGSGGSAGSGVVAVSSARLKKP